MLRRLFVILMAVSFPTLGTAAEPSALDARSRRVVETINRSIRQASESFRAGDFDGSGNAVLAAMKQIDVAMNAGSPELYDALVPAMRRITNAHAMLELEGVSLAPFRRPARPEPMPEATAAVTKNDKPANPFSTDATASPDAVSFVGQVAPMLVSKCGKCHVTANRGDFSMATFQALAKGPSVGTVIFPGDANGSRIVETIESGDMPRGGGKVSAEELDWLKKWINQGAKFDGPEVTAPLANLANPNAATPAAETPMAKPQMATGSETVSFAADVAPLLVENCAGCHINARQQRGNLNLDTVAAMFRGGDSGSPVQPGNGEDSLLVKKLRGTSGDRMPAGGRPPLSNEAISLIATWITEGAKVDGGGPDQPLPVMTQMAWLAKADPKEVSAKRAQTAAQHFALSGVAKDKLSHHSTPHFAIWGDASPATLAEVGEQAEAALQLAAPLIADVKSEDAESFFHGRASIYVSPRRYDYSELARMVEGRSIPGQWQAHWRYDRLSAYIAMVATEDDDAEALLAKLSSPVISLAIATRGADIPRWFADGLGRNLADGEVNLDRNQRMARTNAILQSVSNLKNAEAFLKGQIPPENADLIAMAVGETLLSRQKRSGLGNVFRGLDLGAPFNDAFIKSFNMTPQTYVDQWLAWIKK